MACHFYHERKLNLMSFPPGEGCGAGLQPSVSSNPLSGLAGSMRLQPSLSVDSEMSKRGNEGRARAVGAEAKVTLGFGIGTALGCSYNGFRLTAAHQALPSLGFSRQEHWSGLPFPSPVHESEK